MPWSLQRFQQSGQLHFITFSCYQRKPNLAAPAAKTIFESELERVRKWYGFCVTGYVIMPEHVHLLISEPERSTLAIAIQMLKQGVSKKLERAVNEKRFCQRRYYDFNVRSEEKRIEKLKYLHRNPVTRGLVSRPEDWAWSSFRHYATGVVGITEIESEWTARRRERMGIIPSIGNRTAPSSRFARRIGHPSTKIDFNQCSKGKSSHEAPYRHPRSALAQ